MRVMERIRIVTILILGIVALGLLTWGIGKIYLELVGQSQKVQPKPQDTEAAVLVLPETRFWTCQIGVFQNEANAQTIKAQLMPLGFRAEVINANPWLVGIGLGNSDSDLKELRAALAAKGVSTIPKQISLPGRTFRVAGNGAQLTVEMLTNANQILNGGGISAALEQENLIWNARAGEHPPKDLTELHQYYNLIRARTSVLEQKALGLSLFYEYQRVINSFSGK